MELLSKTRVINRLLQRADGMRVSYGDLVSTLRDILYCNVFLINPEGAVLGHALAETYDSVQLPRDLSGVPMAPRDFVGRLLREDHTLINIREATPFCAVSTEAGCWTMVPINGSHDRMGMLLLTRHSGEFIEEDIVLAEYSATVLGMEMMRKTVDRQMQEGRDRSVVQMAVSSLSYSELEAVDHIFAELNGREGLLVASRIADRAGITRSVIVNALRKLESAGVVEARSLGMKGTHIKILNEKLMPMLEAIKSR
ncbi:GTP-sensing pleiotropic transcriptional regulator CodY [Tumebacillus permanentifrigoris]|uniref:Global transcriptional regulator CodY n=1 Tax=Tumebacillus permanentifrigoris TaxID=378543 RepID=A0A316D7L6_9BACL|nr:GTP-sensing pleiotropic transcriptional regulator CodY [Tumebacillus permanentifrigoris]PWK12719.1 transcriptional pleiotropic repressor [Tumebacillus permanentifrigoris]